MGHRMYCTQSILFPAVHAADAKAFAIMLHDRIKPDHAWDNSVAALHKGSTVAQKEKRGA